MSLIDTANDIKDCSEIDKQLRECKMLWGALFFSCIITPSFSARILGIVPVPSYSHQIAFRPLWKELSLRGHQVTLLTTNPMNNSSLTNLTEIDWNFSYELFSKFSMVNVSQAGIVEFFDKFLEIADDLVDKQLQRTEVKALIRNKDEQFDLLMVEGIYPAMFAFAERFKCPMIGIYSLDAVSDTYDNIGNPTHPILYPDFLLPFSGDMTFFERLTNTFVTLFVKYYFMANLYSSQQPLVEKHFGKGYPPLYNILKNMSMLFVNTDTILHQIRPHLPTVVQFGGGTHLTSQKPLPKHLQELLDSASKGFIYFSLGSNVRSKELPEATRRVILDTLAELPYLVLWKFEVEDLPGKPDNVFISKWFPQQDILRHPNIKLFITHGGQQSMEEAVHNHVPLVGMPFLADQPVNVKKFVSKGFGLGVDTHSLDKVSFKSTILEVIDNPKYRNRVIELAELAKDQPISGLDLAIWWTEYVLRHKGAQHLRSPAADVPLYQYFLLDVIGFCLLVVVITIYLIKTGIKLIFKTLGYFVSKSKVKVQ